MKWVIIWASVLALLAGCAQPEEAVYCIAEAELAVLRDDVTGAGADSLALQEHLAMWYNQNLVKENDPDFRRAYDTILFYTDGAMGSLEILDRQVHLPIYHGTEGERGFGHEPETAFPIGGTGNHPVLVTREVWELEPGTLFVIHILERDLTYRVEAVRTGRDTAAVSGVDYCSLILGDGTQILAVRQDA